MTRAVMLGRDARLPARKQFRRCAAAQRLGRKNHHLPQARRGAGDSIVAMLGDTRPAWSRGAYLPGGDLSGWIGRRVRPDRDFAQFVAELGKRYAWLAPGVAYRLARAYGSRINLVLAAARSRADLGREIAPGLFEAELDYLRREEWAFAPEDVLWRRPNSACTTRASSAPPFAESFPNSSCRTALHAAS